MPVLTEKELILESAREIQAELRQLVEKITQLEQGTWRNLSSAHLKAANKARDSLIVARDDASLLLDVFSKEDAVKGKSEFVFLEMSVSNPTLGVFYGPRNGEEQQYLHMCNIFGPKTDMELMRKVIEAGAKALGIGISTRTCFVEKKR